MADKALNLIGSYFDLEEDDLYDGNVAVPASGDSFSFSVPSQNKPVVAEESGSSSSSSSVIPENSNPEDGAGGDDDGGVGGNEYTF